MTETVTDPKIAREVSKLLLSIGAVSINTKKPFRFVSGILSPMYTDNRLLISYPAVWKKIIVAYIYVLKKTKLLAHAEVLSGTATAAIPHAAVLASTLHLPMVYVRSSKKDHGKGNQVEGTFPKKSNVLIIEDLISTGASTKINCMAIREAGGVVDTCLAITTSTLHAFTETMKELKISLITLTDVQTTIDVAVETKRISEKERSIAESFLQDPAGWGRHMGFE
ncbi:MAG: orotate phosphoribosyltransferase [Patescibacteria group bacterium]